MATHTAIQTECTGRVQPIWCSNISEIGQELILQLIAVNLCNIPQGNQLGIILTSVCVCAHVATALPSTTNCLQNPLCDSVVIMVFNNYNKQLILWNSQWNKLFLNIILSDWVFIILLYQVQFTIDFISNMLMVNRHNCLSVHML